MPNVFGKFALREVQFRFAFIGFAFGALFGSLFSYILMFIMAVCGICIGIYLPI